MLNKRISIQFNKVDGAWTTWGEYSTCTVTCGDGTKLRSRACTDPEPSNGGSNCAGSNTDTTHCNDKACPRE